MAISLSSLCSVRGCDQAMRMVLLENVQRLRLLFPFTLAGSKPNTYSPERLLWYVCPFSPAHAHQVRA